MKPHHVITATAILALAAGALAQPVGGASLHESGSPDMGSAYAGAGARAGDASTAWLNPAGLTYLEGNQMVSSLGLAWFNFEVDLEYPGTVPVYPPGSLDGGGYSGGIAPLLGSFASFSITDDLKAGLAVVAPWGGAVHFDQKWVGNAFIVDSTILGFDFQPTLAYRVTDWLSVGAGMDILYGIFDQESLASPFPGAPPVRLQADGWSLGANVGVLLEPVKGTRVGVTWLSGSDIDFTGDFEVSSLPSLDATVTFHLPNSINVSAYHELTPELALLADFGWTNWSEFAEVPVKIGGVTTVQDRMWEDTWRLGFGAQYQMMDNLLLRAGFSYDSSALDAENLLPDIPAGSTWRIACGGTWNANEHIAFSASYTAMLADLDFDHVVVDQFGSTLHGTYDPAVAHMFGLAIDLNWGGPTQDNP